MPPAVTIDLGPEAAPAAVGWQVGDCLLQVLDRGALLQCATHDHDVWEAAQALGAEPPCKKLKSAYKRGLQADRFGLFREVPPELLPVVEYARTLIPADVKNQRGEVRYAQFFQQGAVQVTNELVKKWGGNTGGQDVTAISWLEEHGVDAAPWRPRMAEPAVVVQMVKAGIDPVRFRPLYKAGLPLFGKEWQTGSGIMADWYTMEQQVEQIAGMVRELDPKQVNALAGAGLQFLEEVAIPAYAQYYRDPEPQRRLRRIRQAGWLSGRPQNLKWFRQACVQGLTPAGFRCILDAEFLRLGRGGGNRQLRFGVVTNYRCGDDVNIFRKDLF